VSLVTVIGRPDGAECAVGARSIIDPRNDDVAPFGFGKRAMAQLLARTRDGKPALLELTENDGVHPATRIESSGETLLFLDPVSGAQRLLIVGAGHIAQPLAYLGSLLGFHVTVIDDRMAFANRERFPDADEVIVKPFASAIESLNLDHHCYLVSVTRGHAFDEEVLRIALGRTTGAFIGMIGSRRRVKATLERIGETGVPRELLDQVHAPLGLDIGAETPEEIAVAIMAEIVRERRAGIHDQFNLGTKLGRLKASQ